MKKLFFLLMTMVSLSTFAQKITPIYGDTVSVIMNLKIGKSIIVKDTALRHTNKVLAIDSASGKFKLADAVPSVSALNDSVNTLRNIRKQDTSYQSINASRDSLIFFKTINGTLYRTALRDSLPTVSATSTTTFTNKRITARVDSTTSSATPTINTDNVDTYKLTAQAADITSFTTNLSGTPTDDQILHIVIIGTATRAITWGSEFEASTVALPTATVGTNRLDVYFIWNTVTSKWRCGGVW